MKNLTALTIAIVVLAFAVLGCSNLGSSGQKAEPGSNKTLTDKGVDTVIGDEKIGVPVCDEVMDLLAAEANNPNDGYIAKAAKAVVLNKIKAGIKTAVENNRNNNSGADLEKTCKDFRDQLVKYKTDANKQS